MGLYTTLCVVILGTCLSSLLLPYECKKLDGYEFPVYSTEFCPKNQEEWNLRSSAINCTNTNGYMCIPNDNFTELLEFCYIYPRMLIQKDLCLYLVKRHSRVNSYNCSNFIYGCPENNYFSSKIFQHPSCIHVENGCFFAEPSCKSKTTTNAPKTTSFKQTANIKENTTVSFNQETTEQIQNENENKDELVLAATLTGVGLLILMISFCSLFIYFRKKFGIFKRRSDTVRDDEETQLPLCGYEQHEPTDKNKEYSIEDAILDQWKQDDINFISTKACKEVEKIIKSTNLVIVAGHSGSGKSAIIQHIALKYREQGWTVKRVRKVEDIVDEYSSRRYQKNKTIFVFNDPFGKESFDEILNHAWQTYEEELKLCLKTAKLLMSCRYHIIADTRVTRYLVNRPHIVNINDNKNKLSVNEKRQILTMYTSNMNLSDKERDEIVKVEIYFPLLCKLYSSKANCKKNDIRFFTEPATILKEEILGFRSKDKGIYCALALLVLFSNNLCVRDLLKKKDTEKKVKHTLKLCGLPENTPPSKIEDSLDSIKNFFVKKVGDTYHFYQDLVMEVTTYVFGNDYPAETIKYADIGFLRKRVRLGDCEEHNELFTIYLSDNLIEKLGERFFTELFGNRLMDVVLNPCLKNKKIIETLKKIIQEHPEKLPMLLDKKKLTFQNHEYYTAKQLQMSKLALIGLENDLSPLFVLIIFSHTDLALECQYTLQGMHVDLKNSSLLSAVYCNGSMQLFNIFSEDFVKESLTNVWGGFYPIHIVSAFHNYKILEKLIMIGVDVNSVSHTWNHWTPLLLAVCNDTQEYGDFYLGESDIIRRNKTVQLLLSSGADINLCKECGASPLYKACQNGHDSTVQLLLRNGADINLCKKNGASPLYIACQNGHDSTVQFLLRNGADINLCVEDGASPLFIACQNGDDSTVQLLLSNGADINLCMENRASPLITACQNGHDSTVQLLLSNGADINLCKRNGASSLYKACQNGHDSTVQLLLSNGADINLCMENGASPLFTACQNGHDSIVNILLKKGADINLCGEDGASPLYIECLNGHDSIVQLLLSNGADINLCKNNGASPLYIACQNGHDSTVNILLKQGADINLCGENGVSPLYKACQNGHDSTVQLLLSHGADINLCEEDGASPLFIACFNGHDSIVQLLLNNGADINLCMENGVSHLFIACLNGHDSTVQLLLSNGANINLCEEDGASPLYIACQNGHDSTVQLLLSHGADINLCEEDGASPLFIACFNGHDSIVQLLLNNGADINLCMENGVSPLFIACQNGHDSTVQLLLSYEADIDWCIDNGISPLYIACQNGYDRTVQYLLSNEANINLCMKDGVSPLYIAFERRRYKTVNILLNNGADNSLACGWKVNPDLVDFFDKQDRTIVFLLQKDNISNNLYDPDSYFSLFVSCQMERVTRMIFKEQV